MNKEIVLTKEQACRFLLLQQGLLGDYRYRGKDGAYAYVRKSGCIQFDPVDVCGRNADLTLQSRVAGYRKKMLSDLLYRDRLLVDYPDKELSIFPTEDWPYFSAYRQRAWQARSDFPEILPLEEEAIRYIRKHGPVSADTLPIPGEIYWHSTMHWSGNWEKKSRASRSVLEQMYTDGRLVIHHKERSRKYYDLAERQLPQEILEQENPIQTPEELLCWRILRRIGAVGLLPQRNTTAFLGISMTLEERENGFRRLLEEEKILPVQVEGLKNPLYMRVQDMEFLPAAREGGQKARCEFLAPLDPFLWDKALITRLFGFTYSWEIYTPKEKRKYGYYVLPVLYGERFAGRIEAVPDRENAVLHVRHFWTEEGIRRTKKLEAAVRSRLKRFAAFNDCKTVEYDGDAGLTST